MKNIRLTAKVEQYRRDSKKSFRIKYEIKNIETDKSNEFQ